MRESRPHAVLKFASALILLAGAGWFVGCEKHASAGNETWQYGRLAFQTGHDDDTKPNIIWQPALVVYAPEAVTNYPIDAVAALNILGRYGWQAIDAKGDTFLLKRHPQPSGDFFFCLLPGKSP